MKQIAQGAEATIYEEKNKITKLRKKKGYRLETLDLKLRFSRARREAKILEKLQNAIDVPKLISLFGSRVEMEKLQGKQLRDVLNEKNCQKLCLEAGQKIGKMHDLGIIHGDLTTSNMMLSKGKVYFIDFGLSFFSSRIEDMAVDLHVLKETLKGKHNEIAERCFDAVLKGYKKSKNSAEAIKRMEIVEARGRYKGKY
ncbi:MAG: KEOPS complex kinase/ATPase Bud32 [Candidatus Woesearchaeota archaeon]